MHLRSPVLGAQRVAAFGLPDGDFLLDGMLGPAEVDGGTALLRQRSGSMARIPTKTSLLGELKRRKVFRVGATYLVAAFVVIQVADLLEEALPRLPVGTLTTVTVIAIIGFPIALLLAWVYELTDQGVMKDEDIARDEALAPPLAAQNVEPRSIAVLPFANLSADDDSDYFSDGVTDDIITSLSRIGDIRVVSRTSVMRYKDSQEPVGTIAAELRVATVLEGSVRRAKGRVRISAQLIDAAEDRHLWVESYDHPLEDIFDIQSDVSRQIAQALAAQLSAEEKAGLEQRPTADVDAYDLYLKGRHLWGRRTVDGLEKSIQYFLRALEHDPEFALAEAGMADSYVTLGMYGMRAPDEVMPLARDSATRALSLDPRMAEASTALATVKALYDWDWSGAEREFRHAIEIQPNYPVAHQWLASNLLTPLGRFEEARAANERAGELDPLSEAIATTCGVIALYSAEYESAVTGLSEVLDVHDRFGMAAFFRGQAEMELGRLDAAVDSLRLAAQLTNSSSEVLAMLAHAYAAGGQTAEARDILASLETRFADGYGSPVLKAQILLGLGEQDRALDLLEEAAGIRAADVVWLGVKPIYEPLRADPRFGAILKTVGLPAD